MTGIDAHHHVWQLARRSQAWLDGAELAAIRRDFTLADLAPLTAAAGIDRTVLVQVLPSPAETAEFLTPRGAGLAFPEGQLNSASESSRRSIA